MRHVGDGLYEALDLLRADLVDPGRGQDDWEDKPMTSVQEMRMVLVLDDLAE